jgi:hypothetical protein
MLKISGSVCIIYNTMLGLSINGLNIPKKIGNKTAFQQARILSRQAINRTNIGNKRYNITRKSLPKRILSFEWSNINFAIDKALSKLIRADKA